MITLYTDTDTDMTPEMAEEYGYKMIAMPFTIEGKEYLPFVDYDVFDYKTYYGKLRSGIIPTTSSISAQNYIDYFEPEFAAGNDVLYVHFSSQLSKTFEQMSVAYEELKERYPERTLYTIDTKGISIMALGIACDVADMFHAGKSVDEILEWAREGIYHRALYMFADDLTFLHRGGRVSGGAAFVGNMIGIRPIICNNAEGKLVPCGKERGRVNAINRLVSYMDELGEDVTAHRIFISHTDCEEYAEGIKKKIIERYGSDVDITIIVANPTIGAHGGPGTIGVSFSAKHR